MSRRPAMTAKRSGVQPDLLSASADSKRIVAIHSSYVSSAAFGCRSSAAALALEAVQKELDREVGAQRNRAAEIMATAQASRDPAAWTNPEVVELVRELSSYKGYHTPTQADR